MKFILIFWGIVLFAIVIKALIDFLPKKFDFSFKNNIITSNNSKQDNEIHLPLQEQYGFILDNVQSCTKNYKSGIYQKGYSFNTSGQCSNDFCKLTIELKEKIPKTISLYIKNGNDCNLQEFSVPKVLNTIGYYIDLQLTDVQKNNLGIITGDKIRLKQASGYSIDSQHQLYFYTSKVSEDTILINDENKGKVYFSKIKNLNPSSKKITTPAIDIPHPKKLFTYTCDKDRLCKQVANTYIINIDGVDFIPSEKFILTCLSNKQANKFCTFFIKVGDTASMRFDSKAMMNSYINMSKNPEFNDSLKTWEKKRLEKAKQKIENSLL